MSWVNDLASVLGIPAGAATLAVAMYAACAAAEKAARPEALKDIGQILKDPPWSRSVRQSAIIERIFVWTFGERHLSWRCVKRSAVATMIFLTSLTMIYCAVWKADLEPFGSLKDALGWTHSPTTPESMPAVGGILLRMFLGIALMACVPDFLAVGKTRVLVKCARNRARFWVVYLLVVADIALSVLISFICASAIFILAYKAWKTFPGEASGQLFQSVTDAAIGGDDALDLVGAAFADVAGDQYPINEDTPNLGFLVFHTMFAPLFDTSRTTITFLPIFLSSTLLTSTWTILILLSTAVVKLVAPIQRFATWFFDVEAHPVQAIGIVSGALVMIASLVWTVMRAVI
jgi:hypothetical protein